MFLGRILFLILTSFSFQNLWAEPNWICTVKGDLIGEPLFFWEKGRDAWAGKGNIDCRSEARDWNIDVELRFESFKNGTGAGPNSKIKISSGPIVAMNPYQLTQRLVVNGVNIENRKLIWESEINNPKWTFKVMGESKPGLRTSLSHGTLEIFIPQFSPRR